MENKGTEIDYYNRERQKIQLGEGKGWGKPGAEPVRRGEIMGVVSALKILTILLNNLPLQILFQTEPGINKSVNRTVKGVL